MGEQVHPQQCHQVGQAQAEPGRLLQVLEQQHRDQSDPKLGSHRILGGTDKGLDLQIL